MSYLDLPRLHFGGPFYYRPKHGQQHHAEHTESVDIEAPAPPNQSDAANQHGATAGSAIAVMAHWTSQKRKNAQTNIRLAIR